MNYEKVEALFVFNGLMTNIPENGDFSRIADAREYGYLYDVEYYIVGEKPLVDSLIQYLAMVYHGVGHLLLQNEYTDKYVLGYEYINRCGSFFYPEPTYSVHPKFIEYYGFEYPETILGMFKYKLMDWNLFEQIRRSRVTIDVDTSTELKSILDKYNVKEVHKYGDPDYRSYHIRIPTYNETDYYLATKLKLELCKRGLLDLDQFAFDLTMDTFSILFNEKIEVTRDHVNYHYESDLKEYLLKPLLNTRLNVISNNLNINDIRCICTYDTKFLKVYCAENGILYVYPTEIGRVIEVIP